jgi:hypothetical protein
MQLSLLSALDAALYPPKPGPFLGHSAHARAPMAGFQSPPTPAQIAYLKKLTRITAVRQLSRYVARKVGKARDAGQGLALTKQDFARAIDLELNEKRWVG